MVAIMDCITCKNASFSYDQAPVFRNVNLEIKGGGTFCILGPNGSGKTTFIDTLFGIHKLTSGEIFLDRRNLKDLSAGQIAKFLAYVPQKHSRHFSFSVEDILLMGRCAHTSVFGAPGPEDRKIVTRALDHFGLSHLKDRDYTRLSGGETQLVMIMRALVQHTPVIIMDEPTAHLDFKFEVTVLETIADLIKKQHKTLIMATHFPNHAFFLENEGVDIQVAFLHRNEMKLCGSPSTALTTENLEKYYGVDTCIFSCDTPGKGKLKQVVPFQSTKDN